MPSVSRACSSARSICFAFDSSRNAARISAEPDIQTSLRFPVKHQAGLVHLGQPEHVLSSLRIAETQAHGAGVVLDCHDLHFHAPPKGRALYTRLAPRK